MSVEKTIHLAYSEYMAMQEQVDELEKKLNQVEEILKTEVPIYTPEYGTYAIRWHYTGSNEVIRNLVEENTALNNTVAHLREEKEQLLRRPQYILPTTFKERLKYLFTGEIKEKENV